MIGGCSLPRFLSLAISAGTYPRATSFSYSAEYNDPQIRLCGSEAHDAKSCVFIDHLAGLHSFHRGSDEGRLHSWRAPSAAPVGPGPWKNGSGRAQVAAPH